jgi:hypothetical protein
MEKKLFTATRKSTAAGVALTVLMMTSGAGRLTAQATTASSGASEQNAEESKFYCNTKALSPIERAHHKEVTEKLIKVRMLIVETPKGYEFQYSPSSVSIVDLAEWATVEAKCCPFFNFHLDLEREGNLVCLGLAGAEGIKTFIRTEFQVPRKPGGEPVVAK